MADAAALRREARRKRILENSQNRLQQISGKCNENPSEPAPISSPVIDETEEVPTSSYDLPICHSSLIPNGALFSESDVLGLITQNQTSSTPESTDILSNFASLSADVQPSNKTLWDTLVGYKYDVVLVSLTMQLLYHLSSVPADVTLFFFPIVIYVLTKIIFFPSKNTSKLINMLSLISRMQQNHSHKLLNLSKFVFTIAEEISIYLFTTICSQVILIIMCDFFKS